MEEEIDESRIPWDVKRLTLYLGEEDTKGIISFEVLDGKVINIFEGDESNVEADWQYEDLDIDVARRLRDFLNYAVPK